MFCQVEGDEREWRTFEVGIQHRKEWRKGVRSILVPAYSTTVPPCLWFSFFSKSPTYISDCGNLPRPPFHSVVLPVLPTTSHRVTIIFHIEPIPS